MILQFLLMVVTVDAVTRDVTDEEYLKFPRLFHLDDYEECMLGNGVYCMGTFEITPAGENSTYELLKYYAEDIHNFNRTRLHRGYCISSRCQHIKEDLDPVRKFEICAERWAEKQELHLKLHRLDYCHSKELEEQLEIRYDVFLRVLQLILLFNFIGTLYEFFGGSWAYLRAWSLLSSWSQLVGPDVKNDPEVLSKLPLRGGWTVMVFLVLLSHAASIQEMLYIGNPRYVEKMSHYPISILLQNSTYILQVLLLISSYMMTRRVLQNKHTFKELPALVMRNIIRTTPVYLLAVGYAATWWSTPRAGPQWTPLVEAESKNCRDKFWTMAFFLGNFISDNHSCLKHSWFIAVDIQLYILGCALTMLLARKERKLLILGMLFIITCLGNVIAAYAFEWAPLMMTGPENVRSSYRDVDSIRMFYSKPWGSAAVSLAGIFTAHLHQHLMDVKFNFDDYNWLVTLCKLSLAAVPPCTVWVMPTLPTKWSEALYIGLEGPLICLGVGILLFGTFGEKGFFEKIFCWRVWYTLGRLSYAALMLHWCINLSFAASRPGLYNITALEMMVDFLASATLSFLAAAPLTLMLDIPVQRMYAAFTSPK